MGELIKLLSQFHIRTKKQKIIKNKEKIQKSADNKRKGQEIILVEVSGFLVPSLILPFVLFNQTWKCGFPCFWVHIQSSPLRPNSISSNNHCPIILSEFSSSSQTWMIPNSSLRLSCLYLHSVNQIYTLVSGSIPFTQWLQNSQLPKGKV